MHDGDPGLRRRPIIRLPVTPAPEPGAALWELTPNAMPIRRGEPDAAGEDLACGGCGAILFEATPLHEAMASSANPAGLFIRCGRCRTCNALR